MKESTSNLASGFIVVAAVAILIAFFSYEIWPIIRGNFKEQTACDKAVCDKNSYDSKTGYVTCTTSDNITIQCPYKG